MRRIPLPMLVLLICLVTPLPCSPLAFQPFSPSPQEQLILADLNYCVRLSRASLQDYPECCLHPVWSRRQIPFCQDVVGGVEGSKPKKRMSI